MACQVTKWRLLAIVGDYEVVNFSISENLNRTALPFERASEETGVRARNKLTEKWLQKER